MSAAIYLQPCAISLYPARLLRLSFPPALRVSWICNFVLAGVLKGLVGAESEEETTGMGDAKLSHAELRMLAAGSLIH